MFMLARIMNRVLEYYKNEVMAKLTEQFGYKTVKQVKKITEDKSNKLIKLHKIFLLIFITTFLKKMQNLIQLHQL